MLHAGTVKLIPSLWARLLAGAVDNLEALDRLIGALPELLRQAIFQGGDGWTTEVIAADEVRQIQAVARLRGEQHGVWVRNFTERETSQAWEEILRGLDLGNGCLDGGVWTRASLCRSRVGVSCWPVPLIPVSSGNAGRLPRTAPGKTRAILYAFIMRPPGLGGSLLDDAAFDRERAFLQKELNRIVECCRMAGNGPEALPSLPALRLNDPLLSG